MTGALTSGLMSPEIRKVVDPWPRFVALLARYPLPVGGEFVGIRHRSIFGSREPGVPREVVAMA